MSDLHPIPFPDLVRRMRREVETSESIFDLPVRKWYAPDGKLDFSAVHLSRPAATPVGPAAGPHTQLAQNIVLAWLAGSRIIELKTVQVNDQLDIPRPCIHVPNVGYNVEWSQELRVGQSLKEYAKAAYLIEILKATRAFGAHPASDGFETIFDISVGYDLEGIRSESVTWFIRALQEPAQVFEALRNQLTGDLAEFQKIDLPNTISDCVTLSTFHGCPADEIESIARYLLEDLGLNVIIKMNPTLLGFDRVKELVQERLGYGDLRLRRDAFEMDLEYGAGLEIIRRLQSTAQRLGLEVGAKFTNTLVVQNDPDIFPTQADPYMYVSGPPLHVLAMNLINLFREDAGFDFPISFSAGIDAKNFPAAVACGMVPVTTCTDLLRQGGFGRLPTYLRALGRQMESCGVTSREAYVLAAHGHGARAAEEALAASGGGATWQREAARLTDLARDTPDELPSALRQAAGADGLDPDEVVLLATRIAGRLNCEEIVPGLADEARYHSSANSKRPRTTEAVLDLYDCINCDLCISACPNDAIFAYETVPVTAVTERYASGSAAASPGAGFVIATDHQLAVYAGACNECSNCEEYCPEQGAPFRVKEQVFSAMEAFSSSATDGFFRDGDTLHARLGGREMRLAVDGADNRGRLTAAGLLLDLQWEPLEVLATGWEEAGDGDAAVGDAAVGDAAVGDAAVGDAAVGDAAVDTADLWRMKTAWDSIYNSSKANPVNPDPAG